MNILYLEHYAGSPEMGMEFRPYYFAREWVKIGYNVRIVAGDYSHLRIKNPEVTHDYQTDVIDGISYTWIKTGTYQGNGIARAKTMFRFVGKLLRDAKQIAEKWQPDVVIASSTYPLDTYAAQKIAKYSGAMIIHEIHDMWPVTLIERGMSKYNPFVVMMQRAENSFCRHSDYVVSLPVAAKSYLMEHGMAPEKFVPIQNGVVEEEWNNPQPLAPDIKANINKFRNNTGFLICFFGSHTTSYAIDYLIKAVQSLKNPKVGVIFIGNGDAKEDLVRLSEQEMSTNFLFLDPIPKTMIPSALSEMDALYVGARHYKLFRFGIAMNKLFDSMMSGKPILYAVNAPNNMITEYDCGISVEPENVEALKEGIEKMLNMSQEERKAMGERGHQAIIDHYTYPKLAEQFAQLFQENKN